MLPFTPKGAIFDVDDTLLDNKGDSPRGLHERSRYMAVKEVGKRHNIPAFKRWTYKDNYHAFHDAQTHSLVGAFWNTLLMTGLRTGETPDPNDPLMVELFEIKNTLHEEIILKEGEPYAGAIEFVAALAKSGLKDTLAVATTAYPRDLNIFFKKTNLNKYFPNKRVISIEQVKHPKPDPEAFELAFKTLGLPDSDRKYVIAFEDNPRGIQSAQGAGLFVIALTNIFSRKELEALDSAPHLIADNFAELSKIFGF
ncbi:MAG TPA: HAD family phosphatase [Candidatus Saccharimonadales bacterium]|nr:HAD family phosphatase [Candidatus Saccharimonadales bacterium]